MLLRNYLQTTQGLSRRDITALIDAGGVFLNKEACSSYKQEIKEGDAIVIPKKRIKITVGPLKKEEQTSLVLFNKPTWYTVAKSDPHNMTIYRLLPPAFSSYYYIGRLDKNSRGLVLMTNDPKLVHHFEHPSNAVKKEYLVHLDKPLRKQDKSLILKGILDEDEFLRTLAIKNLEDNSVHITLNEGKKRHIRRIFKALGYSVLDLQRIRVGEYELGEIQEGKYQKIFYNKKKTHADEA